MLSETQATATQSNSNSHSHASDSHNDSKPHFDDLSYEIATPTADPDGREPAGRFAHPHRVMLGLYLAVFLGMLSETSMNIAIPDLMDEFSVSSGTAQWMVVGYMLAIGVVLPCVGFLLKWIKAKTLVVFALVCFLVGALVCTFATAFPVLLAGRIVQGVSTGIVLPTMFASIMRVFPPVRIGAANGVAGLVIMFAPVVGPTIAGALIGSVSWRAIFALFALIAAVALVLTALFFVTPIERTRPAVDVISIIASAIGFGCLVAGVSLVADMGFSPAVIGLLVVGVVVLAFYARRQLTIADPLLDLRALGVAAFRTPAIMVSCSFACTLAFMYLVPQELQRGLGLSSTVAGLLMLPGGIVNAVCTLVAGRLFDRHGARRLVWIGVVMSVIGGALFYMIGVGTPIALFLAAHIIVMVGIPFIQQSTQSAALKALPGRMAADGSTILNTMQQVCGAISTAVATCLLGLGQANYAAAGGSNPAQGFVDGSRYGYLFGLALIVIVLAFSFLLREHRSEPELVPVETRAAEDLMA
ncbi:DHA2 family efflux MFS transporter permease subunit [Bifidobacterium sp. MA2]|uniref:DHA2 family efflux MFS transporter permease subunit n=1 Tax=Bifidobacterium santillanense TaxID=2809028 RepID=A0ABS5UPV3_9BIFI|nr:DHA2 family efflux MFS transporter permease subunit [Bifidobacterium santillanense]MBT1172843.1 DHA2 family efflux MFS transporter permease subunit [Bifidobacterium santillanense]